MKLKVEHLNAAMTVILIGLRCAAAALLVIRVI